MSTKRHIGEEEFSRREVAGLLGKHVNTVDRLIKEGRLGCIRVGGSVRVSQSQLDDFVDRTYRPAFEQPELPFED